MDEFEKKGFDHQRKSIYRPNARSHNGDYRSDIEKVLQNSNAKNDMPRKSSSSPWVSTDSDNIKESGNLTILFTLIHYIVI